MSKFYEFLNENNQFNFSSGLSITTDDLTHYASKAKNIKKFLKIVKNSLDSYSETMNNDDVKKLSKFYNDFVKLNKG